MKKIMTVLVLLMASSFVVAGPISGGQDSTNLRVPSSANLGVHGVQIDSPVVKVLPAVSPTEPTVDLSPPCTYGHNGYTGGFKDRGFTCDSGDGSVGGDSE